MTIERVQNASSLSLIVSGRLDTTTAPELDSIIKNELDEVISLVIDFEKLEYISSAGLRVLLSAQKLMSKTGQMEIRNVCPEVMEIFEITGFSDILTIK